MAETEAVDAARAQKKNDNMLAKSSGVFRGSCEE